MTMPGSVRLSIVIPTFNRKARLHRVLASLARQTVAPGTFEVVVIDDGSSDGSSESLEAHSYPYTLRPFRQQNGGPARARNHGVEQATGELILFLDDDVEASPGLVAQHLQSHDAESVPLVVMGTLSSLPHYAQPWVAWEQAKVEAQYDAMQRGVYAPSYRQFWTGNASLGRSHIVALGGFNTDFPRGEDVELGIRLHLRGLAFRFNPQAIGLHHAERSLDSWSHAHRSYGRLEVQIFEQLDQAAVVETLAGNLSRLHAGTRLVLQGCLGRPRVGETVEKAMKAWLTSSAAQRAPALSSKVCSILANLLYWQESASALGDARFRQVVARAEVLRATGGADPGPD
jgi:GT2 family glycosyltransferase